VRGESCHAGLGFIMLPRRVSRFLPNALRHGAGESSAKQGAAVLPLFMRERNRFEVEGDK